MRPRIMQIILINFFLDYLSNNNDTFKVYLFGLNIVRLKLEVTWCFSMEKSNPLMPRTRGPKWTSYTAH